MRSILSLVVLAAVSVRDYPELSGFFLLLFT
jgi:hypothetical protein